MTRHHPRRPAPTRARSSPADAYPVTGEIRLRRSDRKSGAAQTLLARENMLATGRVLRGYRGRLFQTLLARIESDADGVDYRLALKITKVPNSERYTIEGRWPLGDAAPIRFHPGVSDPGGTSEPARTRGREAFAAPGRESFPAAIHAERLVIFIVS